MLKKILFIFVIVLYSSFTVGQSLHIKGQFTYTEGFEQVRFVGFQDSLQVLAQSPIKEGTFVFEINNLNPGIYRLQYGPHPKDHYIDIVFNGQDTNINLQMDLREEHRNPIFSGSSINSTLQNYLKTQKDKLEQLRFQYQTYHSAPSKNQKEAVSSKKEFLKLQSLLYKEKDKFIKSNQDNFMGLYVLANPLLIPNIETTPENVIKIYYDNYWKKLVLDHPKMQNTPFYHSYLIDYLGYYANQRLEAAPWEAQMKLALDTMMQYMSKTPYTEKLALKYLIEGFKAVGHEGLLQFVDENYAQAAQCLDTKLQEDVAYRLKSYEIGKAGDKIPNVILNASEDLHALIKGKTLLVFWSSTCPHCMEEWQKMAQWATKNQEYTIIAISLDTDKEVYDETIIKLPKNVKYYCDFKGWESEAIKKYYIMATPTLFEVDTDKKFVKKGKVFNQFGTSN